MSCYIDTGQWKILRNMNSVYCRFPGSLHICNHNAMLTIWIHRMFQHQLSTLQLKSLHLPVHFEASQTSTRTSSALRLPIRNHTTSPLPTIFPFAHVCSSSRDIYWTAWGSISTLHYHIPSLSHTCKPWGSSQTQVLAWLRERSHTWIRRC